MEDETDGRNPIIISMARNKQQQDLGSVTWAGRCIRIRLSYLCIAAHAMPSPPTLQN